jgi:hypothetical protein
MLHDRNLWPDDWCEFIANHLLKEFWYHRQNGYPTIASDILTLQNWNDEGFLSKSRKNASRLGHIEQKRQRNLDNQDQFSQFGWLRSWTLLFIQPQNGLLNCWLLELHKRYLGRLMLLVRQSAERGLLNGFTLTHVNTLKELCKKVHNLLGASSRL